MPTDKMNFTKLIFFSDIYYFFLKLHQNIFKNFIILNCFREHCKIRNFQQASLCRTEGTHGVNPHI